MGGRYITFGLGRALPCEPRSGLGVGVTTESQSWRRLVDRDLIWRSARLPASRPSARALTGERALWRAGR